MPPTNNQQSSDPYGFIMNAPPKPPRKPLLDGSSMGVRIAVVVGGIVLLIVIGVIASSLLNQGNAAQKQKMLDVAASQAEIIRISTLAEKDITSSSTLNYAKTTKISTQSSQNALAASLKKKGVSDKAFAAIRASAKNSKNDKTLETAKSTNKYDETYIKLINESLTNYQKLLLSAAGGATIAEKKILQTAYDSAVTLKKNDPGATPANNDVSIDKSKPEDSSKSIIDNDVGNATEE